MNLSTRKIQERINTKDRRKTMESVVMPSIILRIPESLLIEIDRLAEQTYTNRSAYIRAACYRQNHIVSTLELPFIREHYRSRIPKLATEENK